MKKFEGAIRFAKELLVKVEFIDYEEGIKVELPPEKEISESERLSERNTPRATFMVDRPGDVRSVEAKQTAVERDGVNEQIETEVSTNGSKSEVANEGEGGRKQGRENQEPGKEDSIEVLESSSLGTVKKFDLAQLLLDKKKATHLGSYDVIESDEHRAELEKEMGEEYRTILELLNKFKLSFQGEPPKEDNGIYGFSLII
ncbi:MAG: hypothetical protein AABY26_03615, partial [Nanoarchaeota archaeon]